MNKLNLLKMKPAKDYPEESPIRHSYWPNDMIVTGKIELTFEGRNLTIEQISKLEEIFADTINETILPIYVSHAEIVAQ